MSVKRPRIPAELSDRIDQARGLVPLEAFVRDALAQHLDERDDWIVKFEYVLMKAPRQEILRLLFEEGYGYDWRRFQPDLDALHAGWQEAMDETAVEQEHEEP